MPSGPATSCTASSVSRSTCPVSRRPSVVTRATNRVLARRKCRGRVSGRPIPGLVTSSVYGLRCPAADRRRPSASSSRSEIARLTSAAASRRDAAVAVDHHPHDPAATGRAHRELLQVVARRRRSPRSTSSRSRRSSPDPIAASSCAAIPTQRPAVCSCSCVRHPPDRCRRPVAKPIGPGAPGVRRPAGSACRRGPDAPPPGCHDGRVATAPGAPISRRALFVGAGRRRSAARRERLQLLRLRRAARTRPSSLTPAALDPINGLIATTRLHLLRLDAAIAADQADAARLTPLRDDRQAQLTALEAEFARIEPGGSRPPTSRLRVRRTGHRGRSRCPTRRRRSSRRSAATPRRRRCSSPTPTRPASRYRAAMYGSIAAAAGQPPGGAGMTEPRRPTPGSGRRRTPASDPGPPSSAAGQFGRRVSAAPATSAAPARCRRTRVTALQSALAAEQAAVWAYGLVAAYARDQAAMIAEARSGHLLRRDATTARLVQGGAAAPEPAAAYQVSVAGDGCRRRARQLAQDIETDAAGGLAGGHRVDRRRRAARVRADRAVRRGGAAGHVEAGGRRRRRATVPFPGQHSVAQTRSRRRSPARSVGARSAGLRPRLTGAHAAARRSRRRSRPARPPACAPVARSRTSTTPVRDAAADDADGRHAEQLGVGELDPDRGVPVVEHHPHAGGVQPGGDQLAGLGDLRRPCRRSRCARRPARPPAARSDPCRRASSRRSRRPRGTPRRRRSPW